MNFFTPFSGSSGLFFGSGVRRKPFLTPNDLLSTVYKPSGGYNRTNGGNPIQLTEQNRVRTRLQQPGFTPMDYFRTPTGEVTLNLSPNFRSYDDSLSSNIESYINYDDSRQSDFKFSLLDYVNFSSEKNNLETADGSNDNPNPWDQRIDPNPLRLANYPGTSYDNEDPVYFGFEVVINTQTSPLFNGELEKFLDQFGGDYAEVEARRLIINQFKNELIRYFKFSPAIGIGERFDPSNNIIATDTYGLGLTPRPKRYYVKKVAGLDKLIEANTPTTKKAFVDYGKDILTLSFFEDTTLNLGTLASLYKLMYWSRLRGKSIIPENLLRFDCEIIVSELRDFVKVKRSGNMLQVLKSNLTRYRYQLFECQFWFHKMTHPDSVDMSSIELTNNYDVQIDFKYSNMIFERYDPSSLVYKRLRNGTIDPLVQFNGANGASREYINRTTNDNDDAEIILDEHSTLGAGLTFSSTQPSSVSSTSNTSTISALQQNTRTSLYNTVLAPGSYMNSTHRGMNLYGEATERLLNNLKSAALQEAQKSLNLQFQLLNNSLDKIRSSFGISQIAPPTNVYENYSRPGGFFFDVQNSLNQFAGDVLSGFILGR